MEPFEAKPLNITTYLSRNEIEEHLANVDYILMAAPSMMAPPELPLHFSIFLNTSNPIPDEIKPQILDKFCSQLGISKTRYVLSDLVRVAFAITPQETPMPRHLLDEAEANTIPWVTMHIIDFLGDAEGFKEAKDGLNGWSYSYN
ncbi:MAG: hypothetical protein PHW18_02935 [Sulfuricurvum sp.]|uniref:hypothetical protein n=1 Tax=Sulfuricurvum sp. TaxID=2025608 RepID=UPI0026373598|nr:hypothetical protein [Sulfuricurvum sp.]MDD2828513.1 hypothetical protein [Sulfuricurvum sp.]MDD4948956.1 hypothetical protein [Sulfuricurvum sp.]